MEDPERDGRCALVGLVPGDGGAQGIRREDLVRREQPGGERGLPGAGRADEHDETRVGKDQRRHGGGAPAYGDARRRTS